MTKEIALHDLEEFKKAISASAEVFDYAIQAIKSDNQVLEQIKAEIEEVYVDNCDYNYQLALDIIDKYINGKSDKPTLNDFIEYAKREFGVSITVKKFDNSDTSAEDIKKYINALRQCAKKHEKDFVPTFNIRTSDLCNDTAELLEKLSVLPKCNEPTCNTCKHNDEQDGKNCYECVKGIKDNYLKGEDT